MEKLSFKEAKRLSILKWKALAKGEKLPIECKKLIGRCGFCERTFRGINIQFHFDPESCMELNCEFGVVAGYCRNLESLYHKYSHSVDHGAPEDKKEHAAKILEVIKNLQP